MYPRRRLKEEHPEAMQLLLQSGMLEKEWRSC